MSRENVEFVEGLYGGAAGMDKQARGVATGAAVQSDIYAVLTVRDGKVLRYCEFYDKSAARKAAGLEG